MANEAPGAPGNGAGAGADAPIQGGRPEGLPANVVERSYFDQQIGLEREKRQRQRDEYEAKLAEYEAKLKPAERQAAKPVDSDTRIDALERRLEERDRENQQRGLADAVLSRVPEGNQLAAQDALDAMLLRGEIDLSGGLDTATEKVVTTLTQRRPGLFVDPNAKGPRAAPQRNPQTGAIDWSQYTHTSQVPRDLIGQVPQAEWARMRNGSSSTGRPNI
jgi:hypothetical protein